MTTKMPELSVEDARVLADDLICQLGEVVGDHDAINARLSRWADALDSDPFARVCMAVVQRTYTDCLTVVAAEDFPPGGIQLRSAKP